MEDKERIETLEEKIGNQGRKIEKLKGYIEVIFSLMDMATVFEKMMAEGYDHRATTLNGEIRFRA